MKKFISDLKNLYEWFSRLNLKYLIALLLFIIWMIFFDSHSYFDHRELNKEIDQLEKNKEYYISEIKNDSAKIQAYQNIEQIERFAREKYYMKKENEEIFIIEYDSTSKK